MTLKAPVAAAPLLALVGLLACACSSIPHDVGFTARCASIMRQSFPGAEISVTKESATPVSITDVRTMVNAVRTDLPKGSTLTRNLAVECRFHNGILVGFRWTKGPER